MTDINSCTFTGRLTKDCETRTTAAGMMICRFSFANTYFASAAKKEEASYFDAVMFGKMAESVSPYLKKGTAITLSGELRQQRFQVNGENRSKIEIVVNSLKLSPSGERRQESPTPEGTPPYQMDGKYFSSKEELEAYKEFVFGTPSVQKGPGDGLKGPETFDDSDIPF